MLLYPDAQRTVQKQIDDVIGEGRMPNMEDANNLPYIRCVMKEVLSRYSQTE